MTRLFLLIFASFVFLSCKKDPSMDIDNNETSEVMDSTKYSFLALGDSYTIGESVDVSERWPVQLYDTLKQSSLNIQYPKIIAQTGWRTDNLSFAMDNDEELKDTTFDLVALLIGVNNQYQGRSSAEYRVEFRGLLERALALAGTDTNKVFVVSIPDYGFTPFGANNKESIEAAIDEFNGINKEVSDSVGVTYINITPISRQDDPNGDLVASDNLHPSGYQYKLWVDLMYEEVKSKFK